MILKWNYNSTVRFVEVYGRDEFLDLLRNNFKHLEIYKFSTEWMTDRSFALKARGVKGDLSIRWI